MARRILSAESALMPQAQAPLPAPSARSEARTDPRNGFLGWLQERWSEAMSLRSADVLFDWNDRAALMKEIAFVNETRERIDEAALKLAPAMLRIVLTVKANIEEPQRQRAFLAKHVDWDFRRISELCIVADSYGLLDAARRAEGRREIARYGWSSALKLAYVREPAERTALWEQARGLNEKASYRDVLEEIRRFRERKLIGPPAGEREVGERLEDARASIQALGTLSRDLGSAERCRDALSRVSQAQRALGRLKRALRERIQAADTEALAELA